MRRRGRGAVVLLSGLAGRSADAEPRAALSARSALIEHGAALRRRLSADGVTVTIVVPGTVALRSAARLDAPHIAELAVERIGEAIGSGLRRNREVVAVPGSAVAARRAVRALFRKLRRAVHDFRSGGDHTGTRSPADAAGRQVGQRGLRAATAGGEAGGPPSCRPF